MSKDDKITALLLCGDIKLLDAKWLLGCEDSFVLFRRQDLPAEAFIDPKIAANLYSVHWALICMSYPWLTPKHPDPRGHHFKLLKRFLKTYVPFFEKEIKQLHYGVFWDFASLPQNDADGLRSPDEQAVFARGFGGINYLYGSPNSMVIQLKRLPKPGFEGMTANKYDSRGWCIFEANLASIKPSYLVFNLENLSAEEPGHEAPQRDYYRIRSQATGSLPPMHPENFGERLKTASFLYAADVLLVERTYKQFFVDICSTLRKGCFIDYSQNPARLWREPEAKTLAKSLYEFQALDSASFMGQILGDEGVEVLIDALATLPKLRTLNFGAWLTIPACQFGEPALKQICDNLHNMKALQNLNLPLSLQDTPAGLATEALWKELGKPQCPPSEKNSNKLCDWSKEHCGLRWTS